MRAYIREKDFVHIGCVGRQPAAGERDGHRCADER